MASSSSSSSVPSAPKDPDETDADAQAVADNSDSDSDNLSNITPNQETLIGETQFKRLQDSPYLPSANPYLFRKGEEPFLPIVCSSVTDRIFRAQNSNMAPFVPVPKKAFSTFIPQRVDAKRCSVGRCSKKSCCWVTIVTILLMVAIPLTVVILAHRLWPLHLSILRSDSSSSRETFIFQYQESRYLVYVDFVHQNYVIHRFVNGQRYWSLFDGTHWESPEMYFSYNSILPLPMIDWSDLSSLAVDETTIQIIQPPSAAFSTFAAWPSPSSSKPPVRHLPRSPLLVLTRLSPTQYTTLEFVDGQLNWEAMMQKYQQTYFDPATQSFSTLPLVDQIEQNMPLVVPSDWVSNQSSLLTTYEWPTDNSSWCSPDKLCGLPSCECIRERVDRLTGFTEYNGCASCVQVTDYGCYCWAQVWQYRQLLLSQPCYEPSDDFVRGVITYPCRIRTRCDGLFYTPLNTCVKEIQMCENTIVKQSGFTCFVPAPS
jgi:hypothetical protein